MLSETTWQMEHVQTVANIKASQFRFWVRNAICVWFLSSLFSLMMGLSEPPVRKENAAIWILASFTPTEAVSWKGSQYSAGELKRWMDETIYQGTVMQWALWAAGWGLLPVALMWGGVRWQIKRKRKGEQHIRGAEVVGVEELRKRLRKLGEPGIKVAGVSIPAALEGSHIAICGATGSGKSVTIREILRQLVKRKVPVIVVDPEAEFACEFYDEGRGDYILNANDARCPTWSPWAEGESDADIQAQAASLFPIYEGMADAALYYHRQAQIAYRALLKKLNGTDPSRIPDYLEEIGRKIQKKEAVSTLQNGLEPFRYLRPGTREWSARTWVENTSMTGTGPQGWCFLTLPETLRDALLPLVSLWLESLTRRLLSRPIGAEPPIWIVIDERAVLNAQPTLSQLLARGRKRNVNVVMGFQDKEQLDAIQGKGLTNSMLAQFSTRLLLRTNDGATQQWCAENIGQREVLRSVQSATVGSMDGRDAYTVRPDRKTEDAVMAADFGNFPPLEGVLRVAHYGAARVKVPEAWMIERVPAFIPREEGISKVIMNVPPVRTVSKERRAL